MITRKLEWAGQVGVPFQQLCYEAREIRDFFNKD